MRRFVNIFINAALVTVALLSASCADAHKPEHVAFDFAKVPDILKAAGFQYFTVFEKRKPTFLPL